MRYLIIISIIFIVPCFCKAQKIEENKTDDFTKYKIIRTSWEIIAKSNSIYGHVRISKINDAYYLDIRFMHGAGSVFSIQKGAEVMFKTNTDSIITFYNPEFKVTCRGCGATGFAGSEGEGMELNLLLTEENRRDLSTKQVKKVRIYLTDGYIEDDIKEKFSDVLMRELKLIP